MAAQDYIPRPEGDLLLWLNNYKLKLPDHKATLEVTDLNLMLNWQQPMQLLRQ